MLRDWGLSVVAMMTRTVVKTSEYIKVSDFDLCMFRCLLVLPFKFLLE